MSNKPYKYSRKAGRYVSKTKSGNRNFYYDLLQRVYPQTNINPHSTYGKFILKKASPYLKKYRSNDVLKSLDVNLRNQITKHENLKKENKRILNQRKIHELDIISNSIIKKKYPISYYALKGSFYFSIFIGFVFYYYFASFGQSLISFIVSWIIISYICNQLSNNLKRKFLNEAKILLDKDKLRVDLDEEEINSELETIKINDTISKTKQELTNLQNQIVSLVDELLGKEFLSFALSDDFYNSTDWQEVRSQALKRYEPKCKFCGSTKNLSIDHIYPRSKYPERALDISNTQILCQRCNSSKGNRIKSR